MSTTAYISYSHLFLFLVQEIYSKKNATVLFSTSAPHLFAFVWAISFATVIGRKQTMVVKVGISVIVAMVAFILITSGVRNHSARCGFTYSTTYA